MLTFFQGAALIAATLTMGLMAGVFGSYTNAIMPGLGRTDDRTFVGAFQSIDRAIINPLFMTVFFAALVFTGLSGALILGEDDVGSVLPWIIVAFILYLATFAATIAVNVPLNDGIKGAGDPDRITDLASVRRRFNERKWNRWNAFRTVASTVAFGCLAWALVQYGHKVM